MTFDIKPSTTLICVALLLPVYLQAAEPNATLRKTSSLTFLDSKLFDGRLGNEIAKAPDSIELDLPGRISLSNIPPRLDKWLTIMGENGEVTLQQYEKPIDPPKRGLLGIFGDVFSMVHDVIESKRYDGAKQYNATIYYQKDNNGDAYIDRIVMTRKAESTKP